MVSGLGSVVRTRQSALPLAPAPIPISLPGLVLIFVEPLLYARHATHALPHLRAGQLLGISVTHTYTATHSTLIPCHSHPPTRPRPLPHGLVLSREHWANPQEASEKDHSPSIEKADMEKGSRLPLVPALAIFW